MTVLLGWWVFGLLEVSLKYTTTVRFRYCNVASTTCQETKTTVISNTPDSSWFFLNSFFERYDSSTSEASHVPVSHVLLQLASKPHTNSTMKHHFECDKLCDTTEYSLFWIPLAKKLELPRILNKWALVSYQEFLVFCWVSELWLGP